MLVGSHVSTAGGLPKAPGRGSEMQCEAIQIFNQSPRAWRPTNYSEEDFAEFRAGMAEAGIEAVIIHAVYLINCATPDPELREKSLESLAHALRIGDGIGAAGVVLHPGARKKDEEGAAMARAGSVIGEALEQSESCPVLLEQMAGHEGILGVEFGQLSAIADAAGGGERIGLCLDSCHLFAAGYDIRTEAGLNDVLGDVERELGLDRLRALHINDSAMPFGSRRDRHSDLGEGEMGDGVLELFLSEPRFEGLPATLETPGPDKKGPGAPDVARAKELRSRGLARR